MTTEPMRARNRSQTEAAILDAAKAALAEDGFQGLGVNAVARRAGCDKQLIYRYFGGLDGLVDAVGSELASWIEDSVEPAQPPATYGAFVEQVVLTFLDALRVNPLVQKIMAWEIAEPSPLVARLAAARGLALIRWVESARGTLQRPEGIDAPATNALLIGAVQHLVLAGETTGEFAGVALANDADWARIRDAARRLVRSIYPE